MILAGLKRKSNQLFLNKSKIELLNKMNINSDSINTEGIKAIVILLDKDSEKNKIVKSLSLLFNVDKKEIISLTYLKKADKKATDGLIVSPSDFGWRGTVKSGSLKNILTKKYDLLINYRKVENNYINLVILLSNSKFKVGYQQLKNEFYQLLVNCEPSEIELFNNEIKKYLQILKKR